MPKKIIQDIIVRKIKKTNLTKEPMVNIPIRIQEPRISQFEKKDAEIIEKVRIFETRVHHHDEPEKIHKNGQRFMWILTVVFVVILIFITSSYFSSATVLVTPKSFETSASSTVIISSSPQLGLNYQLVTIESEMSETIIADSEAHVERKAKGTVILYNNYTTVTQRLISNTRLESTDGKIYRIKNSVDIPGYKIIKGVRTPGSASADVVADAVGAEYNIKISDFKGDFKIYAFKGTPKYDAYYGRIYTDIVGGFVGTEKIISNDKLTKARAQISEKLKIDLISKVQSTKPLGFDLLPGSYFIEDRIEDDDNTAVDSYIVKTKSILRAFLFKNSNLATLIASQKIKGFSKTDNVYIKWGDNSSVSIKGKTSKPWEEQTLSMNISGIAQIVWNYDADDLKKTLVGLNKKDVADIIKNKFINSISNVKFTIRPEWNSSFPDKIDKIKIENTIIE
ncbi:MAG: hypothetical protein WCC74_03090 [Minisyncoccia bacterium]